LHTGTSYASWELFETATAEDFSVVQIEGERQVERTLRRYNLDAIIGFGYRVNSKTPEFRKWAMNVQHYLNLQKCTLCVSVHCHLVVM
jgi:hypothetical protein